MAQQQIARTEFAAALNQVCSERGIEPEAVIDTIKAAMIAAYRKDYGEKFDTEIEAGFEFEAEIDPVTGSAKIFRTEGKKRQEVTPPGFGRIAAQTAKQVILQRVREAEKDAIIEEYQERVGSMVSGMVLRFDAGNVVVDIGRGQGIMPPEEQIRSEYYKLNQRVMVLIKEIRDTARGRTIIVSRATPDLVKELFAREVPEVSSGAVEIKAIAREAGIRTKIAVDSTQEGVDPVGSCVGQKGIRVQAVIGELSGEKIDIIQYSKNLKDFIAAALAPAENLRIDVDEKKKKAQVVVPDDQLSLAIGRGGQNVRLAAKLTGFKINIKGETSKESLTVTGEEEFEIDSLKLSTRIRNALVANNVLSVAALRHRLDEKAELEGIGPKALKDIIKAMESMPKIERPAPPVDAEPKEKAEEKTEAPAKGRSLPVRQTGAFGGKDKAEKKPAEKTEAAKKAPEAEAAPPKPVSEVKPKVDTEKSETSSADAQSDKENEAAKS
ncbi:MAG: transcription termination/antitermination protein NusA [Candidatus Chisholmbacteria bacterium]|nr:transcription termination/antitermination protein NusA [Candidatus Chisholmbacteria bacterium]